VQRQHQVLCASKERVLLQPLHQRKDQVPAGQKDEHGARDGQPLDVLEQGFDELKAGGTGLVKFQNCFFF
jgi:hypothetical protein